MSFQIKKESEKSNGRADDDDEYEDDIPEQKELREEKPSISASLTGDSERATLLGNLTLWSFCGLKIALSLFAVVYTHIDNL